MNKVPSGYYFERLYETIRCWCYWFSTPYEELSKLGGNYDPGIINWGVIMNDGTIMSNFWFMVNDGHYDMIMEEWAKNKRQRL